MKTDLPVGTIIRCRNARAEGGYEYGRISDLGDEMGWELGIYDEIKPGTVVHKVVWKDGGTRIESRGTFIFKRT